ncbi:MAG: ABC transporter permease subunit [Methylovirgula sp.]|uniref:ABC transporter permease n=1 Tax=Methylovirgula sp. TaxID=1978224 RepID=UPI0030760D7D
MTRVAFLRMLFIVLGIAIVEGLCRSGIIPAMVLPAPSQIAASLYALLQAGTFTQAIVSTFASVAIAALISIAAGILIGVSVHRQQRLRAIVAPILDSYYAVPTFLFYPILILFLGVGRAAIVGIAVIMAVASMIIATLNGLDAVPRVQKRTARILRLNEVQTAFHVTLPSAMPYLFTGIKLTIAYAFIGVIASEFIMSGNGIGYEISNAYNTFDNQTMYGLMLLVIIVVCVVNGLMQWFDVRLHARRTR